jgi:hypothetical protein
MWMGLTRKVRHDILYLSKANRATTSYTLARS